MKSAWLKKEGTDKLLILFNGWSMDRRIGEHLLNESSSEADLLHCFDYHTLKLDPRVMEEASRYSSITIIAWSFGVWAAQQAELPPITNAIAINGTLYPVDAEKGIHPDIFQATLSGWSPASRQRFNRRMCGSGEVLTLFSTMSPDRSVEDQREELALLQRHFQASAFTKAAWSYNHAIIGGRDMIFPAEQQSVAWRGVPKTMISDMPHFPFFHFRTLEEVAACFSI